MDQAALGWSIRRRERLDGFDPILREVQGFSVLDVGCHRGLVSYELAKYGAKIVHGCDNSTRAIETARHLFSDVYGVRSHFEVVDLTRGPQAFEVFPRMDYDLVLLLGVYHKLRRSMSSDQLKELVRFLGGQSQKYFVWNGTPDHFQEIDSFVGMRLSHRAAVGGDSPRQEVGIWGR